MTWGTKQGNCASALEMQWPKGTSIKNVLEVAADDPHCQTTPISSLNHHFTVSFFRQLMVLPLKPLRDAHIPRYPGVWKNNDCCEMISRWSPLFCSFFFVRLSGSKKVPLWQSLFTQSNQAAFRRSTQSFPLLSWLIIFQIIVVVFHCAVFMLFYFFTLSDEAMVLSLLYKRHPPLRPHHNPILCPSLFSISPTTSFVPSSSFSSDDHADCT